MSSHAPNLAHWYWMNGRHWGVMFKCSRCGMVETVEYDREGNDGNLQCQSLPKGWSESFDALLCPDCTESFRKWKEIK